PIPQSSPACTPDRPPGIRSANPPSATQSPPFDGCCGVRRLYQYPGSTRIAWKFRPCSGKDSPKRSATPRKMGKVELREEQSFDPVDVLDPFHDQDLSLTANPAAVFIFRRRRPNHWADPRFASLVGEQRAKQRLAIDPVGLGPTPPARRRN